MDDCLLSNIKNKNKNTHTHLTLSISLIGNKLYTIHYGQLRHSDGYYDVPGPRLSGGASIITFKMRHGDSFREPLTPPL